MKYTIKVSPEQLRLISSACELLARIHMGQLDTVAFELLGQINDVDRFGKLRDGLDQLEQLITGLEHKNAFLGMTDERVDDRARQAFDIYQVLRHIDAWDRCPEGGMLVIFDEPMKLSKKQPLPVVRKEQE